jgi:hypothetical protein
MRPLPVPVYADADVVYAAGLVRRVCQLAGSPSYVSDLRSSLRRDGVLLAVQQYDTAILFDWLVVMLSFQGISDDVAAAFIADHGSATWDDIARALAPVSHCAKLAGYWRFYNCGYRKEAQTCSEPSLLESCPLPRHPLRNGHLNQMAYSLFLFFRDVAGGDIVSWIDQQLAMPDEQRSRRPAVLRHALLEPLRHVYGISDKVLAVALSSLLIGVGRKRPRWFEVGTTFVGIDTLVHNFFQRTGILQRFQASHVYGPACYQPGGCSDVLHRIAAEIDASAFNPTFPPLFPRFVQHAIWRYCAKAGLNVCNGNRIDDRSRCENAHCRLFVSCDRVSFVDLKTAAISIS